MHHELTRHCKKRRSNNHFLTPHTVAVSYIVCELPLIQQPHLFPIQNAPTDQSACVFCLNTISSITRLNFPAVFALLEKSKYCEVTSTTLAFSLLLLLCNETQGRSVDFIVLLQSHSCQKLPAILPDGSKQSVINSTCGEARNSSSLCAAPREKHTGREAASAQSRAIE